MEGLNLDQAQLERLVELDRKFSREGLTFDDVLLVPAESRVLPNDVSPATRLTRALEIEIPIASAEMHAVTDPRPAQDREAACRRRRGPVARVDHRQGHSEADRVSERDKGRSGPPARRCGSRSRA